MLELDQLKRKHFFYWPTQIQRMVIGAGIFLLYVIVTIFFGTGREKIDAHKKQVSELSRQIAEEQAVIKSYNDTNTEEQKEGLFSRLEELNVTEFMNHLSTLAKQNDVQLIAVKPTTPKEKKETIAGLETQSFQVHVMGEYDDLLKFILYVETFPGLAMGDDFQISAIPSKEVLNLMLMVDLYGIK